MSSSNCCFLTCIEISQEAGQVVWYSHLFQNFPQFVVIHTVKGFGVVNNAEVDVFFWNSLAFLMIQWMLAIRSLLPLPFLNPDAFSKPLAADPHFQLSWSETENKKVIPLAWVSSPAFPFWDPLCPSSSLYARSWNGSAICGELLYFCPSRNQSRELPGFPMVRTQKSYCPGPRFGP